MSPRTWIVIGVLLGLAGGLWASELHRRAELDARWALDWVTSGPCADRAGPCTVRVETTGGEGGRLIVDDRIVATDLDLDLDPARVAAAARAVFDAEAMSVCPDRDVVVLYTAWEYPLGDGSGDAAMRELEDCVAGVAFERELARFHRHTGIDPYDPGTWTG